MKIANIYWPTAFIVFVFLTVPPTAITFEQILYELTCIPVPPTVPQCNWTTVNKTHAIMSIDLFYPTVLEKLKFHIQVFYKYPRLGFKPFLIDTLQDACQVFKPGSTFRKFGELITPHILTNVYNLDCPIEGHWGIKEASISTGTLVGFFPSGEYTVNITAIGNGNVLGKLSTHGLFSVPKDTSRNKNKG